MKIRSKFVSNSSSSSFLVATDEKKPIIKLVVEVDLSELGEKIKTKKQLDEYYADEIEWRREDGIDFPMYDRAVEALKEGKTLIAGYASDDGDNQIEGFMIHGFSQFVDPEDGVEVIEDCDGY